MLYAQVSKMTFDNFIKSAIHRMKDFAISPAAGLRHSLKPTSCAS